MAVQVRLRGEGRSGGKGWQAGRQAGRTPGEKEDGSWMLDICGVKLLVVVSLTGPPAENRRLHESGC